MGLATNATTRQDLVGQVTTIRYSLLATRARDVVRILEPDKLKLWILRAVVEGNETSREVYDYVCSLGYPGSDKAVMMDLKRYANHGLILREKTGGRYRYTPNGVTSDLHNYLEL